MFTKAAALGTLAVEELFGELAATVFQALVASGRLSIAGLISTSSLGPREVKHGLATLVQHGLALWCAAPAEPTFYEPSVTAAYRLLQLGKYTRLIEQRYGTETASFLSTLFLMGNTHVEEVLAHKPHISSSKQTQRPPKRSIEQNGVEEYHPSYRDKEDAISVLVQARVLTAGRAILVRPILDIRKEAERTVNLDTGLQPGTRGKTKVDHKAEVQALTLKWTLRLGESRKPANEELLSAVKRYSRKRLRDSAEDGSPGQPRKMVRFSDSEPLTNGTRTKIGVNGHNDINDGNNNGMDDDARKTSKGGLKRPATNADSPKNGMNGPPATFPPLAHRTNEEEGKEEQVPIWIDYENLALMARNEMLVQKVAETIGHPTARVYRALLNLVETEMHLPERGILSVDADTTDLLRWKDSRSVSLYEIVGAMEKFDDLGYLDTAAIGDMEIPKPSPRFAKKAAQARERQDHSSKAGSNGKAVVSIGSASGSEEEDSDESEEDEVQAAGSARANKRVSSFASRKPDYNDDSMGASFLRVNLVRQHLLMLSEHAMPFLTYHGRASGIGENFSIPFSLLMRHVRREALFDAIHARYDYTPVAEREQFSPVGFDTAGVRVARMLAERGKLDDKALANLSLINPKILRARLEAMHNGGAIGVQEVPRDIQRNANRTLYLWFFDDARCAEKLIEDTYQTMTRLLQRLRSERALRKHLLDKADRSDVKGNEEEYLSKHEVKQLRQWHAFEQKVWSEISRLDELVSLLRDY